MANDKVKTFTLKLLHLRRQAHALFQSAVPICVGLFAPVTMALRKLKNPVSKTKSTNPDQFGADGFGIDIRLIAASSGATDGGLQ